MSRRRTALAVVTGVLLACSWIASCNLWAEPRASLKQTVSGTTTKAATVSGTGSEKPAKQAGAHRSVADQVSPFVPEVLWRFRAASPSSGAPGVSRLGEVYLSTVEGYVHALAADGAFRWSYAISGLPQGGPLVGQGGRVYITTNAGRVHALESDGHLAWAKRSRARITSAPVFSSSSSLLYNSVSGRVRSVSIVGGPAWSRQLGQRLIASPTALAAGGAAVVTQGGKLWWLKRSTTSRSVQLPATAESAPIVAQNLTMVVAGGYLLAYDEKTRNLRWQVAGRRAAVDASGAHVVVVTKGELIWLDPHDGHSQWVVALPGRESAAPLVQLNGTVVLPLVSGKLFMAAPQLDGTALIAISGAPLRTPVGASVASDESTAGRIAVVSGSGQLALVDMGNWPASAARLRSGMAVESP